jgi:hypothetical protein
MFSGGDVQQPEILRCAQNDNQNVIPTSHGDEEPAFGNTLIFRESRFFLPPWRESECHD